VSASPLELVRLMNRLGTSNQGQLILPPLLPYLSGDDLRRLRLPSDLSFPLSPDTYMLTLIEDNVKRAVLTNMFILGFLPRVPDESVNCLEVLSLSFPAPETIPESLRPTKLQVTQRYEALISSFPFPKSRDNMIRHAGSSSIQEMAEDVYGRLREGFTNMDQRAVMVWGEPWMPDAWEFTGPFLRKWKFLLGDCSDLIRTTNRWREIRGEKRLVIDL
jgi:hypothetical protein